MDRVSAGGEIDVEWAAYVEARRAAELDRIIAEENLRPDEARAFFDRALRDGSIQTSGTAIANVLPPASRFSPDGGYGERRQRVLHRLGESLERYVGLGSRE